MSLCLIVVTTLTAHTQAGSLDLTFGNEGIVTTMVGNSINSGYSVALQQDGKMVVAGFSHNGSDSDFAIVRYNLDGTLDYSFDTDGIVTTDLGSDSDLGASVAIQHDGKIVVAGESWNGTDYDFAVVRYNSDGSLDTTFDADGIVTTAIGNSYDAGNSVAIQSDDKIVVAGSSHNANDNDFAVVRYNSDGSLDSTFSFDGKLTKDFAHSWEDDASVVIQSDGKIVVAGESADESYDFALVRYNSDGSLDNSFSTDGKLTTDFGGFNDDGESVAIQNDGKIVVSGYSHGDIAVVRYNSDGSLDNTFSSNGKVKTDFGSDEETGFSVAIQNDGKIVVAGFSSNIFYDFALVRYNSDGSLDNSFDSDGKVTTEFGVNAVGYSVVIQSDGKIVVAGGYFDHFAVARYNDSTVGIAENRAEENTLAISPNPFSNELIIKGTAEQEEIILYDLTGIEMIRQYTSETETLLITERLLPGCYFLHYTNGNKTEITKLLKL